MLDIDLSSITFRCLAMCMLVCFISSQVILCVHTFLMRQLMSREKMLLDQVDGVANLISALHPTSPNSKNKPQVCTSCIFLVRLRFRFCVGICVH